MRTSVAGALRGVLAGVACLAFVVLFFLARTGTTSLATLAGLAVVGVACLAAAAGSTAVLQLLGVRTVDGDAPDSDWWLARLEPAIEDEWNRWSDAVLVLGLGTLGLGSFVLLANHSGDDPPLGLLIGGFLGLNGALVCLAFALR